MKWTFKSHKGIFVPVTSNGEIKALRIHLDKEYKLKTTDIWFSSGNEYQGTHAKSYPMIFIPKREDKMLLYDVNKIPKEDVIITSEILLGYRLFNRDKKITIAIPNNITKKQGKDILDRINIDNVDFYIDEHTISYNYKSIYTNLLNYIPEDKISFDLIINYGDLKQEVSSQVNVSNVA